MSICVCGYHFLLAHQLVQQLYHQQKEAFCFNDTLHKTPKALKVHVPVLCFNMI